MIEVAEDIIAVLAADPNAEVKVTLEIQVGFPVWSFPIKLGALSRRMRGHLVQKRGLGMRAGNREPVAEQPVARTELTATEQQQPMAEMMQLARELDKMHVPGVYRLSPTSSER